ncbi:MAG: capsule biosynthesis protein [Alterinioella nitratireducens]|uniref:capsule biosynthesis protein n=1 Tax=Alterinioella nitratireducens TaxID=2735915 RepID=UPI0040599E0B
MQFFPWPEAVSHVSSSVLPKAADSAPSKPARPAAQAKPTPVAATVKPPAQPARVKSRHRAVVISFIFMVALPTLIAGWYLWGRAADQYASNIGFSVRREDSGSAIEFLGGITSLSGSSSSDTDILYEFLQSQELVARIDADLDLRSIWARPGTDQDPIYAYDAPGTIESLLAHWRRMVGIDYDNATGLIDLRVLAFDPEEARQIAQRIFDESSTMINQLSAIAREDAISYSREELEQAEARLTSARVALAQWRNENQTVDPTVDTAGQMGLVTNLQAQLAEALIELDILRESARENDPRITQAERRISVIEERIDAERAVLGTSSAGGSAFADLVGQYERLVADQEFAERAYTAALAGFDAARNEARRQSRYLAAHVRPTLAQTSQYPERTSLLITITFFAFLIWGVSVLLAYSLRDRR